MPRLYHACATIGLATLLLREITQLTESVHEAMQSEATIWSKKDRILPPFLMCMVLVSITTGDALYYFMSEPLAHVMPPGSGMVTASRPVATLRYIEWIFSVPILLTLTGHCALGRPMEEVAWPILATDVYVLLAWIALVVAPWLRWPVVCACFMGYYFASVWMWQWVQEFLKVTPEETPSRKLRASMVVLLVSLFGVYAIIYLAAIVDMLAPHHEIAAYTSLGFLSKVAMSCILTSIRASEHRQTLDSLLCRVGCLNTTMMSLLRGSFDVVLPCIATNSGGCSLSPFNNGVELRELSIFMGRDMAGATINCFLADQEEKERFAVYVRNSLRQTDGRLPFGNSRWSAEHGNWVDLQCAQKPPLAQVLTVKMIRHSASGDSLVNVVVYIAPVPKTAGMFKDRGLSQMLAAFRFEDCVPMPTVLAEKCQTQTMAKAVPANAEVQQQQKGLSRAAKVVMKKKMTKLLSKRLKEVPTSRCPSKAPSSDQSNIVRTKDARKAPKNSKCSSTTSSTKSHSRDSDGPLLQDIDAQATLEEAQDSFGSETTRASYSSTSTRMSYLGQDLVVTQDVMSQSSKISDVGSVTLACRQLLGPLMDHLPPPQLVSRRMENHVQCAAEMVKLRGPAEITRLHHQQELAEWKEKCKDRALADALKTGSAPDSSIDESVWRNVLLPYLEAEAPGSMPVAPDLPDTEELWMRAWKATYEDSESDGEED